MKAASQIELTNLINEITQDRTKAERIATLVIDESDASELKKTFPTREELSALELRLNGRMDAKAWQIIGAVFVMLSLAVTILKIT